MYQFIDRLRMPLAQGGYGLLGATTRFDVTAHSLDGHMAQRLVGEHSDWVNLAHTFNGAGQGGNLLFPCKARVALSVELFRRLFGAPDNQITNIVSEPGLDMVPSPFTGPRLGPIQGIFAEDQTPVPPLFLAGNHLVGVQVDSLAVHRAFEALNATAAVDYAVMREVLRASSHDDLASPEAATNWLAALFPGAGAAPTIANGDREALHDAAIKLGDFLQGPGSGAYQFVSLVGMSQNDLAALAMQDTAEGRAARYAMLNGVPFTVSGANYGTLTAGATYDVDNFSAEHWRQRAEYFQHQMGCNTQHALGQRSSARLVRRYGQPAGLRAVHKPDADRRTDRCAVPQRPDERDVCGAR
jgi:hypothetical protein